MPTARELLEQADALMRRNRQEAARAPAIPPVPVAVEQRAAVPPIDPGPRVVAEAPQPAANATVPEPVATRSSDADIPVLDDAVEAVADDDVPVLTDAVDEIEVAAPAVDEGEPSDWLAPPAEDESVLGPAPPSVALVPPAVPAPPPAVPFGQRPAAFAAQRSIEPPPEIEDLRPEPVDQDVTIRRPVPTLGAPAMARPAPPEIEDLAEAGATDLDADVTWTRPVTATPATTPAPVTARAAASGGESVAAVPAPTPEDAGLASDELPAPPAPPVAEPARTPPAGAEWDALAEEIRMQVLQRIDMFTDTGLRERLGSRLQPIVDRASADLVDAINQHVGEILRAYVAEAIEREIDRWRAGR